VWNDLVTVAETPTFMRQAEGIWNDEERDAFVAFIAANPEAGDVIPETGGVRKVKWVKQGGSKRGGTRIIYFFYDRYAPVYLLMVYAKAAREDISRQAKKAVRDFAARIKQAHRRHAERRKQ
jgi:hypothetical protein